MRVNLVTQAHKTFFVVAIFIYWNSDTLSILPEKKERMSFKLEFEVFKEFPIFSNCSATSAEKVSYLELLTFWINAVNRCSFLFPWLREFWKSRAYPGVPFAQFTMGWRSKAQICPPSLPCAIVGCGTFFSSLLALSSCTCKI